MSGRTILRPATALVALAFTLAGLKALGRRLAGPALPPGRFLPDPELGWTLPVSAEFPWAARLVHTNSLGLRGDEPLAAPSRRVLVVGDSSVFGDGVSDEQTFSHLLGARLAGVDVQNGGVPGYACPQSLGQLRRLRERYDPDVLVVHNVHSDSRTPAPGDRPRLPPGAPPASGLVRLLTWGQVAWRTALGRPVTSLARYAACLDGMAAAQAERGGSTIFALAVANVDLAEPPPSTAAPEHLLDEFRARMRGVAAATDSKLVDLPQAFRASGLESQEALLDSVHPSARGHELIAATLAEVL